MQTAITATNSAPFNPSVAEWAAIETRKHFIFPHKTKRAEAAFPQVEQRILELQRLFLQRMALKVMCENVLFCLDDQMMNTQDGEVARLYMSRFTIEGDDAQHTESASANLFMCFAPTVHEIRLRDNHGNPIGELAPEAVVSLLFLRIRHGLSMRTGLIAHKEFKQSCAKCKAPWPHRPA